ncbi:hypothetical protein CC80DRAFT_599876 [Byssothecium circinans]|uniref:Uncharacterized protein n=1 Tax=Byssothecium circinans TaxID=147558 RepID=A0A6A5T7L7_9PLEO|nr:hypothetical protein CC80DRAFT_599876 [Byssothecium circinans]
MNTTASPTTALPQQNMSPFQNASNTTMALPTLDPLPVTLVRRHLSPEAVISIVCGVCSVLVPIGIVLAKYNYKRYKSRRSDDPESLTTLNTGN